MFLSRETKYPLGLDISDRAIKFIQLNRQGGKMQVQALGRAKIPAGIIKEGDIKKEDELARLINQAIASPQYGKVTSKEVATCLPEPKTFLQFIKTERSADKKNAIINAIEHHIPLDINELRYEWQITSRSAYHDYILIGAAEKKTIEQYLSLFKKINLNLVALEIEPVAVARALLAEENPRYSSTQRFNYGIIDIGAERSAMTIYSKNTILFSVGIPFSGEEITQIISQKLEIDREQAEKAKIICGLDEERAQGVIKKILANQTNELAEKIQKVITYYNDHYADRGPLNKLILAGGGANIKNLDKIIKDKILIETIIGDALTNLVGKQSEINNAFKQIIEYETKSIGRKHRGHLSLQNVTILYATAIGLALREFFLEEE